MGTVLQIFKIGLKNELAYRFDFIFKMLFGALPVLITILIWNAVFTSNPLSSTIGAFSLTEMIGYLIFANISFAIVYSNSQEIANDIRSGELNTYLLRPFSYLKYRFILYFSKITCCIFFYIIPIIGFAVFFNAHLERVLMYVGLLIISSILNFFINVVLSLITFWFLEVSALFSMISFISAFLAGTFIPLSLMPDFLKKVSIFLPFRFLGYETASIIFTQHPFEQFLDALVQTFCFIIAIYIISKILWKVGVKIYGAYGG